MEKIKTTKEELTNIIVKYLREKSKNMGDKTNIVLPIEYSNWTSGWGRDSKWSHTDISLGGVRQKMTRLIGTPNPIKIDGYESVTKTYTFTDRELTQHQFINILSAAIAIANVRGKVNYDECGDGYWCPKTYRFKNVELFAKPCKEFVSLYRLLEKCANKSLGETEVFFARVCGKRSSWSESGKRSYLCYDAKQCQEIIDAIRKHRTSKDVLTFAIEECFSHGDEYDYEIAQYQESEWYGSNQAKLHITIKTPSGKVKADYKFGA